MDRSVGSYESTYTEMIVGIYESIFLSPALLCYCVYHEQLII